MISERKKTAAQYCPNLSISEVRSAIYIHVWTPPRGLKGWSASLISRAKAKDEEIPYRNIPEQYTSADKKLKRFFNAK